MKIIERHRTELIIGVAFLLLSVTFAVLLFNSLDEHYTRLIQTRFNFGWSGTFTGTRILSILLLKAIAVLGFSAKVSSQILVVLTTFGVLFAFRSFLGSSSGISLTRASLLAPAILIPMVWNYILLSGILFPEDIPALLLYILGLTYLFKRKKFAFHLVFLLAIVNRESSLFLIPAMFLIQVGKRNLLKLMVHIVVLAGIWYGVRLLLMHFFGGGVNAPLYVNVFSQNLALCKSVIHLNPKALRLLMLFGGLWIVLPFCYGKVPNKLLLLTLMLPAFFAIMLYVGNFDHESRIFTEMIPVVAAPPIILFNRRLGSLHARG